MLKELLKYLGIIFMIIGVAILGYYIFNNLINNGLLILAGALMVGGVAVHVIMTRILE
ncbi:hypothetical protein QA597_02095 [Marinilabiliaceae bacterium ANBcel2]|nr:hypothetical protein [Marinilabiliaceae bacterium ANBcel2]